MTDTQLYLAIGVPILVNATFFVLLMAHTSARFSALDKRFDEMRDLWRSDLHRV